LLDRCNILVCFSFSCLKKTELVGLYSIFQQSRKQTAKRTWAMTYTALEKMLNGSGNRQLLYLYGEHSVVPIWLKLYSPTVL